MIKQFLAQLGLPEKQQQIYLSLTRLGTQPASIIAKQLKMDRVTCYKHLKKLEQLGLIKLYFQNNIQYFGIESYEPIRNQLNERQALNTKLLEDFDEVEKLLKATSVQNNLVPKLEVFEGETGIKNFFNDLLFEMKENQLRQIRMLTSNTFNEQLTETNLTKSVNNFFSQAQKQGLDIQIYQANGTLIPEQLQKLNLINFHKEELPSAKGTTNIFIAGNAVYIAYYKQTQIGLKIKQAEITQIFHFMFDVMGKTIKKSPA